MIKLQRSFCHQTSCSANDNCLADDTGCYITYNVRNSCDTKVNIINKRNR